MVAVLEYSVGSRLTLEQIDIERDSFERSVRQSGGEGTKACLTRCAVI